MFLKQDFNIENLRQKENETFLFLFALLHLLTLNPNIINLSENRPHKEDLCFTFLLLELLSEEIFQIREFENYHRDLEI